MSRRVAARLAWSVCVLSVASTALNLWLRSLNLSYPDVPVYSWWKEGIVEALGFSTVGAVIVSRGFSKNPIGWLLCTTGLLFGITNLAAQYAIYALLAAPGSLPAGEAAAWITTWPPYLGLGLIVFIFLLFPSGRLPSDRWRRFAWLAALLTSAGVVLTAFSPGPIVVVLPYIRNPLGIEGLPNAYKPVQVLMIALIAVAVASLLVRRLRARGLERQQMKWFAYAAAVLAGGVILKNIIFEPSGLVWLGWFGDALTLIGLAGIPISMGIAITRYRLYEIDIVINRTLVYGSLSAVLVAIYFGGIVVSQRLFVVLTGEKSTLAVVASTLLIAALFNPLRRRFQSFINRRFYRSKYDARKTLEAFSARLRDETDLQTLNHDLVGVVRETLAPEHVSLWLLPLSDVGRGEESPR